MSAEDWNDQQEEQSGNFEGYKKNNVLPLWGNERTMNMNPLILTNIQSSHYFKTNLYGLKTYHEVIDEIYNKVQHLEPWEKGSRKTSGQTGMCGGVRGVGAGGIVSTAYCLLYKLFTLKMTRKQLNGLINHTDSPYIRALGFMYIRYTQPPADLWDWYEEYLEDEEEVDVKAGGGQIMTMGNMVRSFLTKLEWHSTLFPRIPVPIQQKIEKQMSAKFPAVYSQTGGGNYYGGGGGGNYQRGGQSSSAGGRIQAGGGDPKHIPDSEAFYGEAERQAKSYGSQERDRGTRDYDRGYKKPEDSYKRSYDSKDDKYSSKYDSRDDKTKSTRYGSPERKKYRDDARDSYRDRDRHSSRDKERHSSKHDKYSSSRDAADRYDKYSSRDKYSDRSSSRHDHDNRDRSPRHHKRH
ncbi:hypothetical protein WDU94_006676 [Cyamophila willieti]